jgi:hypothetical protein
MFTEQETTDFGNRIRDQLTTDASIETVTAAVAESISNVAPEHFQAFARILVNEEKADYRARLQKLNVALVKVPAFDETIKRFHARKNENQPASPAPAPADDNGDDPAAR